MHKRVVVLLVVVLLAITAGGGVLAWRVLSKSDLKKAVESMPASTLRASYTDWSTARTMAKGEGLAGDSSAADVDAFLSRAFDLDLIFTSAVADASYAMSDHLGFSVLDASWEMFGQSREGAVAALALPDSVDLDAVEGKLSALGYDAPADGAGSGGVWKGSADLIAGIDPEFTAVLQNLVVLPEERIVLMSDDAAYASSSAEVVRGELPDLAEEVDGVNDLSALAQEPVAAVLFADDYACEALSSSTADEEDQLLSEQLVEQAGGVSPLAGLMMALQPDHSLSVGMWFETTDQAAENLAPRVELATGEAVGQGGTFAERFEVASGKESGHTVVLDLQPRGSKADRAEAALLSDLAQGPVLFATC